MKQLFEISYIIDNHIRGLVLKHLNESQESKSIDEAKKLVMKTKGCSREEADKYVRITIREKYPPLRDIASKFILGITRMVLDDDIDSHEVSEMNKVLKYIANDHLNDYDRNLNGESAETLIDRFADMSGGELEEERAKLEDLTFGERNHRYKIYPINTPKEATKFAPYCDWCVTGSESAYDSYTSDGWGRFYFCIRDDFKTLKREPGNGCPLDDYGLSMIAVSLEPDGVCNTITCRWNHDHKANDHVMTPRQLSEILGVNFYDVFKPFTSEELDAKGLMSPKTIEKKLEEGVPVNRLFAPIKQVTDDTYIGFRHKKYTIIYNGHIKTEKKYWFTNISDFHNGWAMVTDYKKRHSYVNLQNELCGMYFKNIWPFKNGFALAKDADGICVLNTKMDRIYSGDDWYNRVKEELVVYQAVNGADDWNYVELSEKQNFMNIKTHKIANDGKVWFDKIYNPKNGYCRVECKNKITLVDINNDFQFIGDGKLWFDNIYTPVDGMATVTKDDKMTFLRMDDLKLIGNGKMWFDDAKNFKNGFAKIENDFESGLIDSKGNLLGNRWFDDCTDFCNGNFAGICVKKKWVLIDKSGNIIKDHIYDDIKNAKDGFYKARIGDKWTYISPEGKPFKDCKVMFDWVGNFSDGYAQAVYDGKNVIVYDDFSVKKSKS